MKIVERVHIMLFGGSAGTFSCGAIPWWKDYVFMLPLAFGVSGTAANFTFMLHITGVVIHSS